MRSIALYLLLLCTLLPRAGATQPDTTFEQIPDTTVAAERPDEMNAPTDAVEPSDTLGMEADTAAAPVVLTAAEWEALRRSVKFNRWGAIIGLAVLLLLGLLGFTVLSGRQMLLYESFVEHLVKTRKELEISALGIDQKLILLLDQQLQAGHGAAALDMMLPMHEMDGSASAGGAVDHALPLKIADEIVRIEKNLARMDEDVRGVKQLSKAIDRIKDNFVANGYELVDLLGKPYKEGMRVSANFVPDPDLPEGAKRISRVIKPQVNYQGQMIQAAQIEVSVGE